MGPVVSGWEHERIADYGACGVGVGARTDYGACGVGLGARTDHAFETKWNTNVDLTIFLLGCLVTTACLSA